MYEIISSACPRMLAAFSAAAALAAAHKHPARRHAAAPNRNMSEY